MTKKEILALARKACAEADKRPFWSLPFIVRPDEKTGDKKKEVKEAHVKALKKLAYDEDNDTAGIGTWNQNALGDAYPTGGGGFVSAPVGKSTVPSDKGSYFAQRLANAKKDERGGDAAFAILNSVAPKRYAGEPDHDISNDELAELRGRQADYAAKNYFGGLDGVRRYLEEMGAANQKRWNMGRGHESAPVDLPRLMMLLNGKKLTPGQLKILPAVQNSMAGTAKGVGGQRA